MICLIKFEFEFEFDLKFCHLLFQSIGAALEKKSVRDMAAGLNRLGGKIPSIY